MSVPYSIAPPTAAYFLDVGDGHRIYVEEAGAEDGIPVVVLHGGPGAGCFPSQRRFFNPERYRIICYDQRGAGKSEPSASLANNTTWTLVDDIERLREHIGVDGWLVFGGSWGSTLALTYASRHPARCRGLILRGIFTLTERELTWFYQGGTGHLFPEAYASLCEGVPEDERDDLVAAYHARLTGADEGLARDLAVRWTHYETSTSRLLPQIAPLSSGSASRFAWSLARIETHYFVHKGFFPYDGWLLDQADRWADIPMDIVQGRYDVVCPPVTALELRRRAPHAKLTIVPDAGHATSEPGIEKALLAATRAFADRA